MSKIQILLILIPITFIAVLVNGIVHEAGHGLFALLFGGEINYIQPFIFLGNPHISYSDLSMLSFWERALVIAGGALLPIIVGILGIFMVPLSKLGSPFGFSLAAIIFSFLCQALAWILLPFIYLIRGGFQGDDVIAFIEHTGIHPMLVSISSLFIFSFCAWIFFRKTRFFNLARALHGKKPPNPKSYRGNFANNLSFGAWVILIVAISGFSVAHMSPVNEASIDITFSARNLDTVIILESFILEEGEEKILVFSYNFQVERGNFSLAVVNPEGEVIKDNSHTGFNMRIGSDRKEFKLYGPGEWKIEFRGVAEEIKFELSYRIIEENP